MDCEVGIQPETYPSLLFSTFPSNNKTSTRKNVNMVSIHALKHAFNVQRIVHAKCDSQSSSRTYFAYRFRAWIMFGGVLFGKTKRGTPGINGIRKITRQKS